MYVKDQEDLTKVLKKVKTSVSGISDKNKDGKNKSTEVEYELQFAWDKQASYLQAQARAMQSITSMIKHFMEITEPDDERRLRLELLEADLAKRKQESESAGDGNNTVNDWVAAVMAEEEESEA